MKIGEAFDLYAEYINCNNYSKSTVQRCRRIKKRLIENIGNKSISKLSIEEIQAYCLEERIRLSVNSIYNDICIIRGVLRYCKKRSIKCIDYELVPIPKREPKTRDFLTEEEVAELIDSTNNIRTKFIISFLYSSGVRLGEMIQLNRDSIQDRQFQVIGKGKKVRICFIDQRTEKYMNQYLAKRKDDNPALLLSKTSNERMKEGGIQMAVKNAAKKSHLGKHVTPHVLRHSFATNFLKNNGNIRYLSTMLGHSSIETTAIYTHVMNVDLKSQYRKFHTI